MARKPPRPPSASAGQDGPSSRDKPARERIIDAFRRDTGAEVVADFGAVGAMKAKVTAGEPVDVLVNDRLIAHGEVVIVDESFGVRITEIVRDANRRSAS